MASRTCRDLRFCCASLVLEPHERALALLGVPFRPQGRNPHVGLDCLGVVVWAFSLTLPEPPRYRLTDGNWEVIEHELAPWFDPVRGRDVLDSDLVVVRLARSFHFGVVSGDHLIHADVNVGRVVARRRRPLLGRECRIYELRGGC